MTLEQLNEPAKTKVKPFPWYCSNCRKREVHPAMVVYKAVVGHEGLKFELEIPDLRVPKCRSCGELYFNYDADDQISAALRSHMHLLSPEQIRAGREALGLSQEDLAERLDIDEATISRWETGALIQARAMDKLLRIYFAFPQVRSALGHAGQRSDFGAQVVR